MKVHRKDVYQFLFHPLSEQHTPKTKVLATITVIALSVLTLLTFLIPFTVLNLQDNLKAKRIFQQKNHPKNNVVPVANQYFVGYADLQKVKNVKEQHQWQLERFEAWANKEQWEMFHHEHSHYDWWMFPIDRNSKGQGDKYTVYFPEIAELKNDPKFMKNFRRGAELVARSWGWDIITGEPVKDPKPTQKWEEWPVRLGKMADSLRLFGEEKYRANMRKFAMHKLNYTGLENWVLKALGI